MTETASPPTISTVPLGGLPAADTTPLANAPLDVAIIEVRFTSDLAEVPVEMAARLRDRLGAALDADFPSIQPATQGTMEFNLSAGGASWSGDQTKGWQVSSSDGQRVATVFPGSLIWQVGAYERWKASMRAPLEVLLSQVEVDIVPSLVQRIGLRYVDRFADPGCRTLQDWRGKIDDALLGPIRNIVFGSMVRNAQQQVEVVLDGRHGALLRHGPIYDQSLNRVDYMLDLDVFSHASTSFEASDVVEVAERLNRTALSLFQACLSAQYLKSLQ